MCWWRHLCSSKFPSICLLPIFSYLTNQMEGWYHDRALAQERESEERGRKSVRSKAMFGGAILTAAALLLGVPAGVAGGSEMKSSTSGAPIVIDTTGQFTGPVAKIIGLLYAGFEVAEKNTNATGGINGRPVEFRKVDNLGTSQGGVAACAKAQNDGSFTSIDIGDPLDVVPPCLNRAKVINFQYAADTRIPNTYSFGLTTSLQQQGSDLAKYIKTKFGLKKRIGVLSLSQNQEEAQISGFNAEAKKIGLNVVSTLSVPVSVASLASQVSELQGDNVNVVASFLVSDANTMLDAMQAAGYKPKVVFDPSTAQDTLSQTAPSLYQGAFGNRYAMANTTATPAYNKYIALYHKYLPGQAVVPESSLYYAFATVVINMVRAAGKNPTQSSFLTAIKSPKGYPSGLLPILNFSQSVIGTKTVFPATCCSASGGWVGTGGAPIS
jgi:branched-chain amino acid transport system substrate-binding protein